MLSIILTADVDQYTNIKYLGYSRYLWYNIPSSAISWTIEYKNAFLPRKLFLPRELFNMVNLEKLSLTGLNKMQKYSSGECTCKNFKKLSHVDLRGTYIDLRFNSKVSVIN